MFGPLQLFFTHNVQASIAASYVSAASVH
jgi:hypothetical protein